MTGPRTHFQFSDGVSLVGNARGTLLAAAVGVSGSAGRTGKTQMSLPGIWAHPDDVLGADGADGGTGAGRDG